MAVSQNTQNGMYQNHATFKEFKKTMAEAEATRDLLKEIGCSKVRIQSWNNGTKQMKRIEYIVYGWA